LRVTYTDDFVTGGNDGVFERIDRVAAIELGDFVL
jgi:hypothetical protein